VDCIELLPRPAALPAATTLAAHWRERYRAHLARRRARDAARQRRRDNALQAKARSIDIAAAIARARARRDAPDGTAR
jgi:hypothetical protein